MMRGKKSIIESEALACQRRKEDVVQSSPHFDRARFSHAVPAPSVTARRVTAYYLALTLFVGYVLAVLMTLFGFVTLLYGGTLLKLWDLFLRLRPGLDTWVALLGLGGTLMLLVGIQVHKAFDDFWSIRSFRRLYRTCRYIPPIQQAQYRLSYVIAQHPDRFSYAFSGQGVIIVQMRRKEEPAPPDPTEDVKLLPAPRSRGMLAYLSQPVFTEELDMAGVPRADVPLSREMNTALLPVSSEDVAQPQQQEHALFENGERASELLPVSSEDVAQPQQQEHAPFEDGERASDVQPIATITEDIQGKFRVIIALRGSVRLSLMEICRDGSEEHPRPKRVAVPFENAVYQAIIAYLAQYAREWVNVEKIMNHVYEHIEEKERIQTLFNQHISRIRKRVRRGISKAFPQWASVTQHFDLFEHKMDGSHSYWRLAGCCVVSGMELLNTFYHEMDVFARSKKTHSKKDLVKEKNLLSSVHRLITYYSGRYLEKHQDDEEAYEGGYLFEQLHELPFRSWGMQFFKERRKKYIFCLEQVATREYLLWQEIRQPEHLSNATNFYKECAYAASCVPVDHRQGEAALRSCLKLYREAGAVDEAEAFYETYRRRVQRVAAEWSLEQETKALLNEIGFLEA